MLDFFAQHGVSRYRVGIIGYQDGPDYIRTYDRIDFALDPFPFVCGTTTFDALWMGVPEVALVGDCPVGRGGFRILSTLGHPEWVGQSVGDYTAVGQKLAASPGHLAGIRLGLRTEICSSPLMNSQRFG